MKKNELTQSQISEYKNKGFFSPVDILSSQEVNEVIDEINYI